MAGEYVSELVYLNDEIIPADAARISVFDAGFTHAAGLFETLRAYNGRVMRLEAHLSRMQRSATQLDLQLQIDHHAIGAGLNRLMTANELTDARIRIVATPGSIPRPGQPIVESATQTILISAMKVQAYPPQLYTNGMRVCICDHRQNPHDPTAGHKTLAYLPRLIALKQAADRQCQEALWFTTDSLLAEGSVCNVFVVHGEEISTPPLDTPILPGTTRDTVIDLAQANGIPLHERPIDIEVLLAASEVFLTGSVLEVMPVTSIEKHTVGPGEPGPITQRMMMLYKQLVAKECGIG